MGLLLASPVFTDPFVTFAQMPHRVHYCGFGLDTS